MNETTIVWTNENSSTNVPSHCMDPITCFSFFKHLQDVVEKGTGGWKKVVSAFGEDILQVNGEIDRRKLGQIVFSDPAKRKLLNQ